MSGIQLKMDDNGRGAFVIEEGNKQVAEMAIALDGENLKVFHTEVDDSLKGKGVASQLLEKMVAYARKNKKKVIPLCAYVNAQFQRHPEQYADIWNRDWHNRKS
jgi:uncharacterized protein